MCLKDINRLSIHSSRNIRFKQSLSFLGLQPLDQLIGSDERLGASSHVLQGDLASGYLALTSEDHEGNLLLVGIRHLFLHLRCVGEELGTYTCLTHLGNDGQAVGGLCRTEVDEKHLCAGERALRIKVESVENIVNAVNTEGDANA